MEAALTKANKQLEELHKFKGELLEAKEDKESERKEAIQRAVVLQSEIEVRGMVSFGAPMTHTVLDFGEESWRRHRIQDRSTRGLSSETKRSTGDIPAARNRHGARPEKRQGNLGRSTETSGSSDAGTSSAKGKGCSKEMWHAKNDVCESNLKDETRTNDDGYQGKTARNRSCRYEIGGKFKRTRCSLLDLLYLYTLALWWYLV